LQVVCTDDLQWKECASKYKLHNYGMITLD
jgi:hypothetical protein